MNSELIIQLAKQFCKIGSLHSIGEEWISYTGIIPNGGIPYSGQEVSRAAYKDLWNWVVNNNLAISEQQWQTIHTSNNGNVSKYSTGDGETTFRMPKCCSYLKATNLIETTGLYTTEGLPNILGTWEMNGLTDNSYKGNSTGALEIITTTQPNNADGFSAGNPKGIRLDASKSNPIYGNSDHVTPETVAVVVGVYGFGIFADVGETDIQSLANNIAVCNSNIQAFNDAKIDKTIPHIIDTYLSADGLNWGRKYSDGFVEQGGTYTINEASSVISFYYPFKDVNFTVVAQQGTGTTTDTGGVAEGIYISDYTTTSFRVSKVAARYCTWVAYGYS